jgi:hypothetical protein
MPRDCTGFLQVPGRVGQLALAKFRQENFVYSSLTAMRADDRLLEIWTHGLIVDPDLPDVAIEFLFAALALEVDLHFISIVSGFKLATGCKADTQKAKPQRARELRERGLKITEIETALGVLLGR